MGFYTSQENTYRGKKDSVIVEKLQNKPLILDIIGSNISIYQRKFSCSIVINPTPQASNSTGWNGKIWEKTN